MSNNLQEPLLDKEGGESDYTRLDSVRKSPFSRLSTPITESQINRAKRKIAKFHPFRDVPISEFVPILGLCAKKAQTEEEDLIDPQLEEEDENKKKLLSIMSSVAGLDQDKQESVLIKNNADVRSKNSTQTYAQWKNLEN